MRRTSTLFLTVTAVAAFLSSCAPQAFVMTSEMRMPSKSGLDLGGKSMAVAYLYGEDPRDTLFNNALANGFASRLEDDYFGGSSLIELFKLPRAAKGDYSSKDSLVNLILDTGKDVVFLFDVPEFGIPNVGAPQKVSGDAVSPDSSWWSAAKLPFTTKLYVYDAMNKEDKVLGYAGSNNLSFNLFSDGKTDAGTLGREAWQSGAAVSEAGKAGAKAAASFLPTWKEDSFSVIYYDGAEPAWNKAAESAYAYRWKEAIDLWMTLLGSKSREKRACAEYNIALACFMTGQPDLALEWLDRSDEDTPVSLSAQLRQKIKTYTGKGK